MFVSKYALVPLAPRRSGRGRPCKWVPRRVTPEDMQAAKEFLDEWATWDATPERIRNFYVEFKEMNFFTTTEALIPWIGQCLRDGLQVSSLDTYLSYLRPLFYSESKSELTRVAKALSLAHADADTKTARDAEAAELVAIIAAVPAWERAIVWFMFATGARVRDLKWLRRSQIKIEGLTLWVQFRITKARRARSKRVVLRIALSWFSIPDVAVRTFLEDGAGSQRLFSNWDVAAVNNLLSRTCARLGAERLTSYSFRRNFMAVVLAKCGNDAVKAKAYSLHLNPLITDAHYARF